MTIALNGSALTVEKLFAIARYNEKVELSPEALDRIKIFRAMLEDKLAKADLEARSHLQNIAKLIEGLDLASGKMKTKEHDVLFIAASDRCSARERVLIDHTTNYWKKNVRASEDSDVFLCDWGLIQKNFDHVSKFFQLERFA